MKCQLCIIGKRESSQVRWSLSHSCLLSTSTMLRCPHLQCNKLNWCLHSIHPVQSHAAHAEITNLFACYADSLSRMTVAVARVSIHPLWLQSTFLRSLVRNIQSTQPQKQGSKTCWNFELCFTHELIWSQELARKTDWNSMQTHGRCLPSWEKRGTKMGVVAGEYARILMVCTFNLKEIWVANNWPNASRPDTRTGSSEKRPWGEKLLGSLRQDPTLLWKAVHWCWQQKCCPCWS